MDSQQVQNLLQTNALLEKELADRNIELKHKSRELEIEAALEKVRTKAMAMLNSSELSENSAVMFQQLKELNINAIRTSVGIFDDANDAMELWLTALSDSKQAIKILDYVNLHIHPVFENIIPARAQKKPFVLTVLAGNEVKQYYQTLSSYLALPQQGYNNKEFFYSFFFLQGAVNVISSQELSEEECNIMIRLAQAFGLIYTRFLDLQKAEAQAREAKIEAALERIRSRSMAMHKTSELKEVVTVVFEKLQEQNIQFDGGTSIVTFAEGSKDCMLWVANPDLSSAFSLKLPFPYDTIANQHIIADFWNARESGLDFFSNDYSFEEKNTYFKYLFEYADNKALPDNVKNEILETQSFAHSVAFAKNSALTVSSFSGKLFLDNDADILKRFAKVFEQVYIRFLDLQKAEAQAREAQIEAALERVRSRTMVMQKSEELREVVAALYEQFHFLGFEYGACNICIMDHKSGDMDFWMAGFGKKEFPECYHVNYFDHPAHIAQLQPWKNGEKYAVIEISGNEKKAYDEVYFNQTDFKRLPDETKKIMSQLNKTVLCMAYMKYGALIWGPEMLAEEKAAILQRFAKVFEQTYTRFLDLEKAEAQAREAKIEAALEKVRSRSLGMHKSDELKEVVQSVFERLNELHIEFYTAIIYIFTEGSRDTLWWLVNKINQQHSRILIKYADLPYFRHLCAAKENRKESFSARYSGEEKKEFYKYLLEETDFKYIPEEQKTFLMESEYATMSAAITKNIGIHITRYTEKLFSEEDNEIIKRFARVFDQAYTRFLDLQKAEAQAREAKIEAALEKVRSRTMAMQHSEELSDAASLLFKQIADLGTRQWSSGFDIWNANEVSAVAWMSNPDGSMGKPFIVPYTEDTFFKQIYEAKQSGTDFFVMESSGKELEETYQYLFNLPDAKKHFDGVKSLGFQMPKFQITHCAFFSQGYLMFITFEAAPEMWDIFKRFAKVFEQTYTRFLDLQKAEAQAREAQIEAGLERVRSRTLAMQKSDELAETSVVLFRQLIDLGIAPNRLFIGIIRDESGDIEAWATNEDGTRIETTFTLSASKNDSIMKMYVGWKQQKKSIIIDMRGEELKNYFHYLNEELKVPFKGGLTQKRRIQTIAFFSKGFIGMAAPEEQPAETTLLLERFAAVFNLTFTRFNDLKIAEAHAIQAEEDLVKLQKEKRRAEDALTELQATQKQLIQSEKMASLGELTAGIAHEIQNPLNFVNNFSEVNKEMIAEMKEEINKGNYDEVKIIADDIEANEEKINHHGKRADAIVKGMLQHSRSSTGVKEPTDINALADEYLRLSYHGLRAKDKTFNVTLKTDFDESIGKINISPQDIGRVLLNLYNNAFYAVNEQKNKNPDSYEPTVSVSTKKSENSVLIIVSDNGGGIPQKVVNKIFQPFFTTKPTGEGTGLGLSLSYDIIKAHGGEIKVETKEGEGLPAGEAGTEFIIQLPIV